MSDKHWNSVVEEAVYIQAVSKMSSLANGAPPDWDGMPQSPPDLWMKAWFIDPYWYMVTSNGVWRVISNDQQTTDEDIIFTAGE